MIEIQTCLIKNVKMPMPIFPWAVSKIEAQENRAEITLIDGTVLYATSNKVFFNRCHGYWPFKRKWVALCATHKTYHEGCVACNRSFRRYTKLAKLLPKMYPMKKKEMWRGKPNFTY
jgi:hypothetical protein